MTEPDSSSIAADGPGSISPTLLLAAIIDSSEDAIVSKNLRGIVTSWNQGAERLFGYRSEEMVGQSITRLFPTDRLDEERQILERLQRGERVAHFETVRVCRDGRCIDLSLTISPVRNNEGEIVGASKIARDITEQKRAAKELAEAHAELQRADRMKIEFISTLSHELRTPLTAIIGWVNILKEGGTEEELAEGLEIIERNVRMQAQLIDDLLDMSRIEAGKLSLDLQRLDPSTVVTAAIETVRPTAAAKEIRLTADFPSNTGYVMGDRNRLQQVVWNLLTNALKFTGKGGRIHVTIEHIDSQIEISVADTGAGVAADFLPHIFERFRQADASTTRKHGGLGLGLAIVKHLTELHGGSIVAKSQGLGRGATFVVSLPMLAVPESDPEAGTGAASGEEQAVTDDLTGIKVLCVEDDADSAGIVRRILTRRGAEVRSVSSMEEALAAFQEFAPNVVLSDIGMPGHDGYELIARIRALPGGRVVPAVALTALARSEDRTRALRAGFQMHVAKPVDGVELIAVVRTLANLRAESGG